MRTVTLLKSLLVFAVWLCLTVGIAALMAKSGRALTLEDTIGSRIGPSWGLALAFLIGVTLFLNRPAVGLREPVSARSLLLLWVPVVYLAVMLFFASASTPLPLRTAVIVIANTIMVGMSEELMFRGILFEGLLTRLRIWPAALLSSVAFGVVHVLNGLATGQWIDASIQALSAFMLGIGFMAIRIRTGSLYPMMIVHAIWDVLLIWQVMAPGEDAQAREPLGGYDITPIWTALPMLVFGLFLMRRLQRDYGQWSAISPAREGSAEVKVA